MALTYEPIATTTLGSNQTNITFSSVPNTYTDLRVILNAPSTVTGGSTAIWFNGDVGSPNNYSMTQLYGSGSSAGSTNTNGNRAIETVPFGSTSTTLPTFLTFDIFSYTGSTNKTVLATHNADYNGSGLVNYVVGLWRSTAVISTINVGFVSGASLATGTTATLYGIKAA